MTQLFNMALAKSIYYSKLAPRPIRLNRFYSKKIVLPILIVAISLFSFGTKASAQEASTGSQHRIEMFADKLIEGEDYLAYRMMLHEVTDQNGNTTDITSRYSIEAIVPGPTIIMDEGDVADITLFNRVPNPDEILHQENVSLHVHGVHYQFHSDGTLKYINLAEDQGATLVQSYTYRWDAAPGTAGTWPYHDHNMNTHNGAEDKGLFGALIVNPASGNVTISRGGNSSNTTLSSIQKEYVLYVLDDIFVGTEIDSQTGEQTPVWVNPTLTAQRGSNVRFHLIALGTNLSQFSLPGYGWVDAGTNFVISEKAMGPLEKHVVTIQADTSSNYMNTTFSGVSQGMIGRFNVNP